MTFTATLDGNVASIVAFTINNQTAVRLHNANDLGSQLLAFATDPNTAPVDTPAYRIDPTDTGLRITNATGQLDLPWRWITPVGNALNA
jgi:hypothetical protein